MSRIWRLAAPVAVAAGLIAAGVAPAAQASPATYGVTISATSPHYPGASHGKVLGFALVVYKATKGSVNTAVISGNVTGAMSGDVATLYAEPFGTKSFTSTGSTVNLTGVASQAYSFAVKPSLATKYEVKVTTVATLDATSAVQTVYVTEGGSTTRENKKCSGTKCTVTYREYEVLPSSAYKTEVKKHLYLYDTVIYRTVPKYIYLSGSAKASKARKVNAGEFVRALTFHVTIRRGGFFIGVSCSKDTETVDGLGLPGKHGCGLKRFSSKATYLG